METRDAVRKLAELVSRMAKDDARHQSASEAYEIARALDATPAPPPLVVTLEQVETIRHAYMWDKGSNGTTAMANALRSVLGAEVRP